MSSSSLAELSRNTRPLDKHTTHTKTKQGERGRGREREGGKEGEGGRREGEGEGEGERERERESGREGVHNVMCEEKWESTCSIVPRHSP